MTPAETPTECAARKENTTGFRQAVWDLLDEDADLNRCGICGHEYFSDDNWDDIDPHAVEYAEHLNHHTRVIQEKDARIRELEAQVSDGLDSWPSFGITNGQRQWRLQAKTALARSEAKP